MYSNHRKQTLLTCSIYFLAVTFALNKTYFMYKHNFYFFLTSYLVSSRKPNSCKDWNCIQISNWQFHANSMLLSTIHQEHFHEERLKINCTCFVGLLTSFLIRVGPRCLGILVLDSPKVGWNFGYFRPQDIEKQNHEMVPDQSHAEHAGKTNTEVLVLKSFFSFTCRYVRLLATGSACRVMWPVDGRIGGFTVADVILVVGQTRQNLQWMYGKNRDFDAR